MSPRIADLTRERADRGREMFKSRLHSTEFSVDLPDNYFETQLRPVLGRGDLVFQTLNILIVHIDFSVLSDSGFDGWPGGRYRRYGTKWIPERCLLKQRQTREPRVF